MLTLFENVYPSLRHVSASQFQAMLRLFQQDLFSGLVEVNYSPHEKFFIFLQDGQPAACYRYSDPGPARYEVDNLAMVLAGKGDAQIRVCPLSPRFTRALRTLIEQQDRHEIHSLQTSALAAQINEWQSAPDPSLVHIQWPSAQGFVFLPGKGFTPRQYLFVNADQASESAAAAALLSHWNETTCEVSRYPFCDTLAWQENSLHFGFTLLAEQVVSRYEELAGGVLLRKMEDSINSMARIQSWNIAFIDKSVDDIQTFASLQQAVTVYRAIFQSVFTHTSAVIGPKLLLSSVREGIELLSPPVQVALHQNNLLGETRVNL